MIHLINTLLRLVLAFIAFLAVGCFIKFVLLAP